jgi:hypothetical protein
VHGNEVGGNPRDTRHEIDGFKRSRSRRICRTCETTIPGSLVLEREECFFELDFAWFFVASSRDFLRKNLTSWG